MRTKCKGPTCGRAIVMALNEEGKWIPIDDRAPIYRLVKDGQQDRAIRIPLGDAGVLHHVTCRDRAAFAAAAAPLTHGATQPATRQIGPRHWEREVRDPSTGETRLERAEELAGPWSTIPPHEDPRCGFDRSQQELLASALVALQGIARLDRDSSGASIVDAAQAWLRDHELDIAGVRPHG